MYKTNRDNIISGIVYKVGDNIDTDRIYPSRFLGEKRFIDMGNHAMAGIDKDFPEKFRFKRYSIVVAGENFGCGSSREQAAISLKYACVRLIISSSFSRIFYRNAVNLGIPLLEGNTCHIKHQDFIEANWKTGYIYNKTSNTVLYMKPLPPFLISIVENGGIIPDY